MYFEKRHIREATVLDCFGRFSEEDHDPFMQTFESLYKEGCRYLVVNLTSVYQVSENITGLLKFAYEYFSVGEGKVALVSPLSSVRQTLNQTDITNLIPTYMTVYDSLHRREASVNKPILANSASPEPGMKSSGVEIPTPKTEQNVDEMVGAIE
ncbi:MAG: STAS domain-containing protein [Nitrospirota bacterium]|nr:STAS domain-containing protein [Nitrospirota bacterium]